MPPEDVECRSRDWGGGCHQPCRKSPRCNSFDLAQGQLAAGQCSAILFFVPEGPSREQYPLGDSHLLPVSNSVVVSLSPNVNEIKTLNHSHNIRVPLDILIFTPFISLKLLIAMYFYLLMSLLYPLTISTQ